MTITQSENATRREKALAWSVHLYTASGAIWGLLAVLAIMEADWRGAFLWICVTLFIDAVDGTLARKFRVKDVVPSFDGALLDNIVDYFTYVIVPAVMVYKTDLVPPDLMFATLAMVTLSSAFQFCQVDAKTDDHYFKGFPSYWNLLVIYLFVMDATQWTSFGILLLCTILVFVPIKYIYPSRTTYFKRLTMTLNTLWGIAFLAMISLYPEAPPWLAWGSLLFIVYYVGLSLYLTFKTR